MLGQKLELRAFWEI